MKVLRYAITNGNVLPVRCVVILIYASMSRYFQLAEIVMVFRYVNTSEYIELPNILPIYRDRNTHGYE